jgi:hypothetical protein
LFLEGDKSGVSIFFTAFIVEKPLAAGFAS